MGSSAQHIQAEASEEIQLLAYGAGVDSTALLALALDRDRAASVLEISRADLDAALPHFEAAVFADTGAEMPHTYANLHYAQAQAQAAGLELITVRNEKRGPIDDYMIERGVIPFFAGGAHTCSKIWKQEPMHRWADDRFGCDTLVRWSIGIAADEGRRVKRFNGAESAKAKGSGHLARYPLIDLGLSRDDCERIIPLMGWEPVVRKSACYHCPFNQDHEWRAIHDDYPELWAKALEMEAAFAANSTAKHQNWLDLGKPVNRGGRAIPGCWKADYWNDEADPVRLSQRRVKGRRLSLIEMAESWECEA